MHHNVRASPLARVSTVAACPFSATHASGNSYTTVHAYVNAHANSKAYEHTLADANLDANPHADAAAKPRIPIGGCDTRGLAGASKRSLLPSRWRSVAVARRRPGSSAGRGCTYTERFLWW